MTNEPFPSTTLGSNALPPPPGGCLQCGAQPAVDVSFRRGVGIVIVRKSAKLDAKLCQNCGQSFGREFMDKTLYMGWWGLVSFFVNLAYVGRNAISLAKLGRLSAPLGGTPAQRDPGKPIFARIGFWVALVILSWLAWQISRGASADPDAVMPIGPV